MRERKYSGKVGWLEKIVYGSGDVGLNVMYTLFSSYVMYFYTDVIAINAAIIVYRNFVLYLAEKSGSRYFMPIS